MKELLDASDFLRLSRRKMRSGMYSREPLTLLRFEWKGGSMECDWLMRPADPWDKDIHPHVARENQTLQSLRDALDLRDIVFRSFPAVTSANLRMFRMGADSELELVMTGCVSRTNEVLRRVASVAMRARMCGFHFSLAQGVLERMAPVSFSCP